MLTTPSRPDLKNTSDDAIPNYLSSLKFTQSHTLTDTRLALGYSAFVISAACFLWDYQLGFDATKQYTAVAVVLYAILNMALTAWIMLREKSIVYQGTSPDGEKVHVSGSACRLHTLTYLSVVDYHLNPHYKERSCIQRQCDNNIIWKQSRLGFLAPV